MILHNQRVPHYFLENPDLKLSESTQIVAAQARNRVKALQKRLDELDLREDIAIANKNVYDKMTETRQKATGKTEYTNFDTSSTLKKVIRRGESNMQIEAVADLTLEVGNKLSTKERADDIGVRDSQEAERDLPIQPIINAQPVNIQSSNIQEVAENEASNWVNSHILELSNTYGVAFVGFEKETLALFMRIDGKLL
ncbi:hypothetical protein T459_15276 [Capsicum annuum]|uniref:Uncharacterized protein n=1 Tax=Capsicum annuum TaxID=4072 RepID=A0A2G2ZJZ5_CAPAN|nr:hypothetical protein T459_15276 [Capsicum annuum]